MEQNLVIGIDVGGQTTKCESVVTIDHLTVDDYSAADTGSEGDHDEILPIGVAKTAREWLDMSDQPSALRSLDSISSKDVYEAAKEGDALAIKIFEYTGTLLGQAFADFIAFSSPEAIVLFGGLARSKEFLTEPILRSMNDNVLPLWKNKVQLVYSQLKESDAAILGASALAWER